MPLRRPPSRRPPLPQPPRWLPLWCLLAVPLLGSTPAAAQQPTSDAPRNDTTLQRLLDEAFARQMRGDTLAAVGAFRRALRHDPTDAPTRANLAFALLAVDSSSAAVEHLRWLAERSPEDGRWSAQLGYTYLGLRRHDQAAEAFERALALDPGRLELRLQLGYLLAEEGHVGRARQAFEAVRDAADGALAARADSAVGNLRARGARYFGELYAAPSYQARFDNLIVPVTVRAGGWLGRERLLAVYLSLRGVRDTRSEGGGRPEIFSDNVVLPAVGVRYRWPSAPVTLYAEAGRAYGLLEADVERTGPDLRAGVLASTLHAWGGDRWTLETSGDAGWYSRYENAIAYGRVRVERRLFEEIRATWTLNASGDARGRFYNNVVETGPGLDVSLGGALEPTIRVELLGGTYLSGSGPYGRTFADLRVSAIFSRYRSW